MSFENSFLSFIIFQLPAVITAAMLVRCLELRKPHERITAGILFYCSFVIAAAWLLGMSSNLSAWKAFILSSTASIAIIAFVWLYQRKKPHSQARTALVKDQSGSRFERIVSGICDSLAFGVALVLFFEMLSMPSMGFDSLTYHLYFPATWIQNQNIDSLFVPLVLTGSIETYPINAELLTAWWMLPTGNDDFAKSLQILFWLASYSCLVVGAETLGVPGWQARAGSFACVLLCPIFRNLFVVKNDLVLAYFWLCSVVFMLKGISKRRALPIAGLAFGLALGTKTASLVLLPAFALGGIVYTFSGDFKRRAPWIAGALALCAIIASPIYIWNMIRTGNPVYPMKLALLGVEFLKGPLPAGFFPTPHTFLDAWRFYVGSNQLQTNTEETMLLLLSAFVALPVLLAQRGRTKSGMAAVLLLVLTYLAGMACVAFNIPYIAFQRQMLGILLQGCLFMVFAASCVSSFSKPVFCVVVIALITLFASRHILVENMILIAVAAVVVYFAMLLRRRFKLGAVSVAVCGVVVALVFNSAASWRIQINRNVRHEAYAWAYGDVAAGWNWVDNETRDRPSVISHVEVCPYPLMGSHLRNKVAYTPNHKRRREAPLGVCHSSRPRPGGVFSDWSIQKERRLQKVA